MVWIIISEKGEGKRNMLSVLSSVVLAVMTLLLSGWVIFCAIQFFRFSRKYGGFRRFLQRMYNVEKCGMKYDVSAAEFSKSFVSKYKRVTRTRIEGGAFVNRPRYSFYAKKFYCPKCGKRRYAQILNVNELNGMMEKTYAPGGNAMACLYVHRRHDHTGSGGNPHALYKSGQGEQHVEELKEQRYEEFKERYGF